MISVSGKKWIEQKVNKNSVERIKQDFNFDDILARLIVLRNYDITEINNINNNLKLINVLKGDMSLVGPRPALFSQEKLRNERKLLGVYNVRPGITGLSQVSGLDTSTPELLAKTDAKMISSLTLVQYFKFIIATATGKGSGDAATR